MKAGKLRFTATIQSPVKTRGANGEQLVTWSDVAIRPCSLAPAKGNERPVAGIEVEATVPWVVGLRYEQALESIGPEWQLIVNASTFRISAVENVGNMNRELRCYCTQHA